MPRRRERGGVAGPGSTTIRLFRSKEAGYVAMRETEEGDGSGRSVRQRVGEPSTAVEEPGTETVADEPLPQEPVPEDTAESEDEGEDDEEIGDP